MQEKTSQNFTDRLEALKHGLDLSDEQLSDRIGLSRRMLYLIRTGKSAITKKTWYRLEQAESEAGIKTKKPETQLSCVSDEFGEYMTDKKRAELRKELNGMKAELVNMCNRVNRIVDELG